MINVAVSTFCINVEATNKLDKGDNYFSRLLQVSSRCRVPKVKIDQCFKEVFEK